MVEGRHRPEAGWWQVYRPPGAPVTYPVPSVLVLSLLSGLYPLLPFQLTRGRALETMASSRLHLRTAHWLKPQLII